MKNILLYGIWGVYNYGCEAIIRGTVNSFKQLYPEATISYASFNVEEDKRRLRGCDVKIIKRPFHNSILKRGIRKALSYFKIEFPVYTDSFELVDQFDAIVSIGGDMYTLSAEGNYPYSLMKFGDVALQKGKKYILWGCSIGPFENYPKIQKKIKEHLKNVSLIVSREQETVKYLEKIDVKNNVMCVPDPAFNVAPENTTTREESSDLTIGINLSPLSALYYTKNLEEIIHQQADSICGIIDKFDCKIILLPHVISSSLKDDDFSFLEKIEKNIATKHPNSVSMVINDPGFIGIKEDIKKCDLVISARMHCAVNAITTNTPAIFLAYSKKAIGMAELVYGSKKYVLDLAEFANSNTLIQKIEEIQQLDKLQFISNVKKLKSTNYLNEVISKLNHKL